ncbi:uncharacterized protein LOC125369731 [Ricinus communis]|uniref:uncharacterized protein LOC125369731 n=1 Tax=Ricinus communis TaxID=3988 RepID=UPI00201ABD05|nr:uncharacterized protein LOC125369731 [Ricinus communis]
MKVKYQGSARVKRAQLQRLCRTFKTLEMKLGEGVSEYFTRVMSTANDMRNCGENMNDIKIVEKILRSLTDNFNFVVCSIEESKDIDHLTVDELQASLLVHEQKVIEKRSEEQVLQVENEQRNIQAREIGVNYTEFDEEELLLMAHTKVSKAEGKGIWFLDSRCSNHMTRDKTWFVELEKSFKHSIRLGNSSRMAVQGKGSVRGLIVDTLMTINRMFRVYAKMKPLPGSCLKMEEEDLENL